MPPTTDAALTTVSSRRQHMLDSAVQAFARKGYPGTTTAEVAQIAGVSQPRIIQIFGTKLDLFIETHRYAGEVLLATFGEVAHPPFDPERVGRHYTELVMRRPELILVVFHAFAASHEPRIADEARRLFFEITELIRTQGGASDEQALEFLSRGMIINAALAMRLPGGTDGAERAWMNYVFGLTPTVERGDE